MIKFNNFFEAFTLQMCTRDSLSIACKATYYEIDEQHPGKAIYKDPKTVCGTPKKSHKGLLCVLWDEENERFYVKDNCTIEEEQGGLLQTVFEDSKLIKEYTFDDIRTMRKYYAISSVKRNNSNQ